jgi:hypothetical protein
MMNPREYFQILAVSSLLFFAGCSAISQEHTASTPAQAAGVHVLPEGGHWQDVLDASEESIEWEAKTYQIGPNDVSFEVDLVDPVHPDMEALPYTVVLKRDARGFPLEYRMFLRTGVCLDGTCKLLEATLYWDALGHFVRFEYPQGTPFTKMEHDPFSAADYEKLHGFLADSLSILGTQPLGFFVVEKPEEGSADSDTETSATPPDAKVAVIEGAAYTTWVLWRWVHGEVMAQLLAQTNGNLSVDYLLECLQSDNSQFVQFALNTVQAQGLSDERFYPACLAVLEVGGQRDSILAVDVLTAHSRDQARLNLDLVERIGINRGSGRVILNYFKKIDRADPQVWQQLATQIQQLSDFIEIDMSLDILDKMAGDDAIVRDRITELLQSENPFIVARAKDILG